MALKEKPHQTQNHANGFDILETINPLLIPPLIFNKKIDSRTALLGLGRCGQVDWLRNNIDRVGMPCNLSVDKDN